MSLPFWGRLKLRYFGTLLAALGRTFDWTWVPPSQRPCPMPCSVFWGILRLDELLGKLCMAESIGIYAGNCQKVGFLTGGFYVFRSIQPKEV